MFAHWLPEQWNFRADIDVGGKSSSFVFDEICASKFRRMPFDLLRHTRDNISKIGHFLFEEALGIADVRHRSHVQDDVRRFSFVLKEESEHIEGAWCDLKSVFLKNKLIGFSL